MLETKLDLNGWTAQRFLGIGDQEHVRSGVFSVGLFGTASTETQLQAAISAANKIGIMLRAHMNFSVLDEASALKILYRNPSHQIIEHYSSMNRTKFDEMIRTLDVIVTGTGSTSDLIKLICHLWASTGGRSILEGNFKKLTYSELINLYPTLTITDTTFYWEKFRQV